MSDPRDLARSAVSAPGDLTIRRAGARDLPAVARLAQLDSATVPAGDLLLAEEEGELRAALSLRDGTAVADPFHRTDDLVTALRVRAPRLREPAADVRGSGLLESLRGRRRSAAGGELSAGRLDVAPAREADGRLHAALR